MMVVNNRNRIINAVYEDLDNYETGLLVTLNTFGKDEFKLTEDFFELVKRLNSSCYGRQFDRKEKQLRVVGVIETGQYNQGLHMHLIIMHNNDTRKTFSDIEVFIRENWYNLIHAKARAAKTGNLVDLKPVYSLLGIIEYITKTFSSNPKFNLLYS